MKMSYDWFNRQEILRKTKERHSNEKSAEYYAQSKEAIKEKLRERYKNVSQEEKDKIKEYQRKKYQELVQYKKEALENKYFFVLCLVQKMSEIILKFDNIRVSKKEFHKSEQPIDLMSVNVNQIVLSDKLNIVTKALPILFVTKKVKLLNRYVLSYLK